MTDCTKLFPLMDLVDRDWFQSFLLTDSPEDILTFACENGLYSLCDQICPEVYQKYRILNEMAWYSLPYGKYDEAKSRLRLEILKPAILEWLTRNEAVVSPVQSTEDLPQSPVPED